MRSVHEIKIPKKILDPTIYKTLRFHFCSLQIGNKGILSFLLKTYETGATVLRNGHPVETAYCPGGCRKPRCVMSKKGCSGMDGCKLTYDHKEGVEKWSEGCNPPEGSEEPVPATPPAEAGTDYSDNKQGL